MKCLYYTRNKTNFSILENDKIYIGSVDILNYIVVMNEDYEFQRKLYSKDIHYLYRPHEKLIFEHLKINHRIYPSLSEIDFKKEQRKIFSDWRNIKFFPDVPREVKERFLQMHKCAAIYMKDATEEMILEALDHCPYEIHLLKNPSEAMVMKAVRIMPHLIRFIENPSEEMKMASVKQDGIGLPYIQNPSEAVQIAAVERNGLAIQYIENPSEAVKMAALKQNGYAIMYIQNPSEALQMAAIKQSKDAILYIRNPCKAALEAAKIEIY